MIGKRSVVVVGAGLAGLTAAIDLVEAGWQVTLIDRRPFAGGRAFSFTSPAGDVLDNGQHVFLGCCTAYLRLLRKLGQQGAVCMQPRLNVPIAGPAGRAPARLTEAPLPAPFHLLPALLGYPYLSVSDKLGSLKALMRVALEDLPENESFASWLRGRGLTAGAIRCLWDLIIVPTCNAPADCVSAAMGGFVFREGLLRRRSGARIGYPRVGLSDVIPRRALGYLQASGASIKMRTSAERLDARGLITGRGERLTADAYVLAVPSHGLPALEAGDWATRAKSLRYASIVGVNLWFDRPVLREPVMAVLAPERALWVFDRRRILSLRGAEYQVTVSISAADDLMDIPRGQVAAQVAGELRAAVPGASEARVLRSTVEKVRWATFVPAPGSTAYRLSARTPLPNVFLAGSWTATGWPDTMESAVRSGHTAARLVQDFGQEAFH